MCIVDYSVLCHANGKVWQLQMPVKIHHLWVILSNQASVSGHFDVEFSGVTFLTGFDHCKLNLIQLKSTRAFKAFLQQDLWATPQFKTLR